MQTEYGAIILPTETSKYVLINALGFVLGICETICIKNNQKSTSGVFMLTKGWDTISIIKQDRINNEIKKIWVNIDSKFYYKFKEKDISISGEFLPWRIVNGGSGKNIRMELPIKKGVLYLAGKQYNLENSCATIQTTLIFDSKVKSACSNSNKIFLKTAFTYLGEKPNQFTNSEGGWIFPINFFDSEGQLGIFSETVLKGICCYLLENSDQLSLIFAEIDLLNEMCPNWLRPVKTAYTYLEGGFLCILAVCNERDISGLPLDINVSDLNFSTDSCFIISSKLVLLNMIMPSIYSLYQNISEDYFEVTEKKFVNSQDLKMNEIKAGLIYYTPIVYQKRNEGVLNGDCIDITYKGSCDLRANIAMNWFGKIKMSFSHENGTISFKKVSEDFSHSEDIPWYLKYVHLIVSIIVHIIVAIISDNLINKIRDYCISIDTNQMNTIEWFEKKGVLSSVCLKDSLILEYS